MTPFIVLIFSMHWMKGIYRIYGTDWMLRYKCRNMKEYNLTYGSVFHRECKHVAEHIKSFYGYLLHLLAFTILSLSSLICSCSLQSQNLGTCMSHITKSWRQSFFAWHITSFCVVCANFSRNNTLILHKFDMHLYNYKL